MNRLISGLVGLCIGIFIPDSLNKVYAQDAYRLIECLDLNNLNNRVGIGLRDPKISRLYSIYLKNGEEIIVMYRDYPPYGKANSEDHINWNGEIISMDPLSESESRIKKLLAKYCS